MQRNQFLFAFYEKQFGKRINLPSERQENLAWLCADCFKVVLVGLNYKEGL
jgi:hypothetical protein